MDEWQGHFYPKGLPVDDRLKYYSSRLHSVEINNSFYQMPKPALLERWRSTVPDDFRFALKAPRRFTHSQRLKVQGEAFEHFLDATTALGPKLGPVLFQLPPFLRKDAPLLADFLTQLPATLNVAFEFRHRTWFDDEVYALLASKNAALCGGDADERAYHPPFIATASFGYLRLRAERYDADALRNWTQRIIAERWADAYVYMKHEILGPEYALFIDAVASGAVEPPLTTAMHVLDTAQTVAVPTNKSIARATRHSVIRQEPTSTAAVSTKQGVLRAKPRAVSAPQPEPIAAVGSAKGLARAKPRTVKDSAAVDSAARTRRKRSG